MTERYRRDVAKRQPLPPEFATRLKLLALHDLLALRNLGNIRSA